MAMGPRRARTVLLVVGVVVLAAAVGVGVLLGRGGRSGGTSPAAGTAATVATVEAAAETSRPAGGGGGQAGAGGGSTKTTTTRETTTTSSTTSTTEPPYRVVSIAEDSLTGASCQMVAPGVWDYTVKFVLAVTAVGPGEVDLRLQWTRDDGTTVLQGVGFGSGWRPVGFRAGDKVSGRAIGKTQAAGTRTDHLQVLNASGVTSYTIKHSVC
jgi:hypothetical protein